VADALRVFFLAFYAVGVLVLVLKVLPAAVRNPPPARRPAGLARHLHVVLLPAGFLVPPIVMWLRVGEMPIDATPLRLVGLALGVYAAAMMLSAAATLGRFLVPQPVTVDDHSLVTSGPYRFLRHPAYSGDLALWLGCALGTMNALLLALWPLYLLGARLEAIMEEGILEAHFGAAYRDYAARTGRLVPRLAR
jgi:protein-S-isoprenylcysteine O-methyltransferase Ste14